jgi:hypothetical protein
MFLLQLNYFTVEFSGGLAGTARKTMTTPTTIGKSPNSPTIPILINQSNAGACSALRNCLKNENTVAAPKAIKLKPTNSHPMTLTTARGFTAAPWVADVWFGSDSDWFIVVD